MGESEEAEAGGGVLRVGEGGGRVEEGEIEGAGEGGMAVHAGGSRIRPGEDEKSDGGDCLKSPEGAFRRPSNGRSRASGQGAIRSKVSSPAEIDKQKNFRLTRGVFSATCSWRLVRVQSVFGRSVHLRFSCTEIKSGFLAPLRQATFEKAPTACRDIGTNENPRSFTSGCEVQAKRPQAARGGGLQPGLR